MRAKDLKVGDIYIPRNGPIPFRNVRHQVVRTILNIVVYITLDKTFREDGRLLFDVNFDSSDYMEQIDSWNCDFILLKSNRRSPLPKWW